MNSDFACIHVHAGKAVTAKLTGLICTQVEYKLPPHASSVSPEAMDLLQHILVDDPAKRFSLQDMQNHPW